MTRPGPALFDAHHLGLGQTGNETWARCVVAELELDGQEPLTYAVTDLAGPSLPDSVGPERTVAVAGSSTRRLLVDLPRAVRQVRPSALLVQYSLPPASRVPGVVVVHDLSFEDSAAKQWIPPLQLARYKATIRWSARRAARVLVPTEWTRQDVISRYGISPDRVGVATNALDPVLSAKIAVRSRPERVRGGPLTVLCVGTVLPRKNLSAAARAVAMMRAEGADVRLRLVGPARDLDELARIRGCLPDEGSLIVSGPVSQDELAQAYLDADALCFPSRFEGFGIPVLEAMAARTPVVASNATCLPEVAGGAALLVDPDDDDGWAAALALALADSPERAELVRAGSTRVGDFSWSDSARAVRDALSAAAR